MTRAFNRYRINGYYCRGTQTVKVGGMPWPNIKATQYHAQLGLQNKCCSARHWKNSCIIY